MGCRMSRRSAARPGLDGDPLSRSESTEMSARVFATTACCCCMEAYMGPRADGRVASTMMKTPAY